MSNTLNKDGKTGHENEHDRYRERTRSYVDHRNDHIAQSIKRRVLRKAASLNDDLYDSKGDDDDNYFYDRYATSKAKPKQDIFEKISLEIAKRRLKEGLPIDKDMLRKLDINGGYLSRGDSMSRGYDKGMYPLHHAASSADVQTLMANGYRNDVFHNLHFHSDVRLDRWNQDLDYLYDRSRDLDLGFRDRRDFHSDRREYITKLRQAEIQAERKRQEQDFVRSKFLLRPERSDPLSRGPVDYGLYPMDNLVSRSDTTFQFMDTKLSIGYNP